VHFIGLVWRIGYRYAQNEQRKVDRSHRTQELTSTLVFVGKFKGRQDVEVDLGSYL
jgi:hypothetical protein